MEKEEEILEKLKLMVLSRYPRFGAELAGVQMEINSNLPIRTAGTDGKKIYFDPNFIKSLNDEGKLFIIAHEIMHIKFDHMNRLKDKDGNLRNNKLWNIATDAIINANLEKDGFEIPKDGVKIPNALDYSSEELYEILLQKQEMQSNQADQKSDQSKNQEDDQEESNNGFDMPNDVLDQESMDDHDLWENKDSEDQKEENFKDKLKKKIKKSGKDLDDQEKEQRNKDEKSIFEDNREERTCQAKELFDEMRNKTFNSQYRSFEYIEAGASKMDWKNILKREFDREQNIWSQRRSISENNYAYRLDDFEMDDESKTEVMIDVSGSVDHSLVLKFLKEVRHICKDSKLRVACFDNLFYDFKEIHSDIDIYKAIATGGGGTDFNLATSKFSKDTKVNKVMFTDGYGRYGGTDNSIIWIIYDNPSFSLKHGKVFHINSKEIYFQKEEKTQER